MIAKGRLLTQSCSSEELISSSEDESTEDSVELIEQDNSLRKPARRKGQSGRFFSSSSSYEEEDENSKLKKNLSKSVHLDSRDSANLGLKRPMMMDEEEEEEESPGPRKPFELLGDFLLRQKRTQSNSVQPKKFSDSLSSQQGLRGIPHPHTLSSPMALQQGPVPSRESTSFFDFQQTDLILPKPLMGPSHFTHDSKEKGISPSVANNYAILQLQQQNMRQMSKIIEIEGNLQRTLQELQKQTEVNKQLQEQIRQQQSGLQCPICLDASVDCLFLRCGHFGCCWNCSKPLQDCPFCLKKIVERVKVFVQSS